MPSIGEKHYHPHLDEPAYDLRGVFGQLLHFAVQDEGHQNVLLVGLQHDVAHCHGWSGYCLRSGGVERTGDDKGWGGEENRYHTAGHVFPCYTV